jgi:hypothetical protein
MPVQGGAKPEKVPRPAGPINAEISPAEPAFREELYRAREIRGDFSFGEQVIDIADDSSNDWGKAANGRKIVNKELVLRSKLRIEARQFHMSRLHRDIWGDRQQVDVKTDYSLLTEEERLKKAYELIGLIEEIKRGPEMPPPLEYRGEEPEEDEPAERGGGIG